MSIGSINCSSTERKRLVKASQFWRCSTCGSVKDYISEKMKEENKENDEVGPKEKLPEFKFTKKISKNEEKKEEENKNIDPKPIIEDEQIGLKEDLLVNEELNRSYEVKEADEINEEENKPQEILERKYFIIIHSHLHNF